MVKLSILRRLDAAEDTALPADDQVIGERQRKLFAILGDDPIWQEAMAVTSQYDSTMDCLSDPTCRQQAKQIPARLQVAYQRLLEQE